MNNKEIAKKITDKIIAELENGKNRREEMKTIWNLFNEDDYCSKGERIEYVERKRKMLRDLGSESGTCDGTDCKKCPFFAVKNSKNISCYDFEREHPLEAIKLIMGYECKKPILNDDEKEFLKNENELF